MEKKDITQLAQLARIGITENEAEEFAKDITNILGYVSEIEEIIGNTEDKKKVGVLHSVMREDIEAHEPGVYTEDLLNSAPNRKGQYIEVKKILEDKA